MCSSSRIYSGALTGKYTPENPPTGPRGRIYTPEFLTGVSSYSYNRESILEFCALYLLHQLEFLFSAAPTSPEQDLPDR